MAYSIMRGWAYEYSWNSKEQRENPCGYQYRFLAIKLKCTLETETYQRVWVYAQHSPRDLRWYQIEGEGVHPAFLKPGTNHYLFPNSQASGVHRDSRVDQDERFTALRTLLQTGQATDLHRRVWKIPGHKGRETRL